MECFYRERRDPLIASHRQAFVAGDKRAILALLRRYLLRRVSSGPRLSSAGSLRFTVSQNAKLASEIASDGWPARENGHERGDEIKARGEIETGLLKRRERDRWRARSCDVKVGGVAFGRDFKPPPSANPMRVARRPTSRQLHVASRRAR